MRGRANDLITGRMDSNTTRNDFKLLEIVDTGRRRRFSMDAKRRIVEESFASDSVSAIARRHGLLLAQLFAWRRAAREGQYASANGRRVVDLAWRQGRLPGRRRAAISGPRWHFFHKRVRRKWSDLLCFRSASAQKARGHLQNHNRLILILKLVRHPRR